MEYKSNSHKGDLHLSARRSIELKFVRVGVNSMLNALDAGGYKGIEIVELVLEKTLLKDLKMVIGSFRITTRVWLLHEGRLGSRMSARGRRGNSDIWYVERDGRLSLFHSHFDVEEERSVPRGKNWATDEVEEVSEAWRRLRGWICSSAMILVTETKRKGFVLRQYSRLNAWENETSKITEPRRLAKESSSILRPIIKSACAVCLRHVSPPMRETKMSCTHSSQASHTRLTQLLAKYGRNSLRENCSEDKSGIVQHRDMQSVGRKPGLHGDTTN